MPDLIPLDIILPDTDGWALLKTIRQDSTLNNVPVFFVSAQDLVGEPLTSEFVLATVDGGIHAGKLLDCSLSLAETLTGT